MNKRKLVWRIALCAVALLALAAFTVFVLIPLFDTSKEDADSSVRVYGYTEGAKEYTLENDRLLFTLDPATTHFTVTQKDTGMVWYSNPPDADADPIALAADKATLKSTLSLVYSTTAGAVTLFNNYAYSIEKGIYEVEAGEDFLKIMYSLGKVSRTFVVPVALTATRFTELTDKMEKADSKQVKEYYKKYDINKLKASDDKEALLAQYPDLENEIIYVLRDGTADYLKEKVETFFAKIGYTYEDFEADAARTNAENTGDKPVFNVSLIYRLDGGDLVVEVPYQEIEYNPLYPITKLTLLPYLGAGGTADTGFMLVPDGGGALIRFNNGKLAQNPYYSNIYGWDYALYRKNVVGETRSAFPLFGVSKGDGGFICLLEDGASTAAVSADIAGRYNSYNNVCAVYTVIHGDSFDITSKANAAVMLFEKQVPQGAIRQRYRFLQSGGYAAMAGAYRDYILSRYPGLERVEDTATPVAVEIVGAIDKVLQKGGLPTSVPYKLTTYTEAREIMERLVQDGYTNLSVKYAGWMNGGMMQKALGKATLIRELGDAEALRSFVSYGQANGIDVYLDGVTQFAYDSGLLEGFSYSRDAAKFTTREEVELREYSNIWYGMRLLDEPYYLLKPSLAVQYMRNLAKAADTYGAQGISFRDAGYLLAADYNPKELVTREQSLALQREALKQLGEQGKSVWIRAGNLYAVEYADLVTGMDLGGDAYSILDENIPFYQMALHGYLRFTGESLNLIGDYERELLLSAESGAGLSFTFMMADANQVQDTLYSEYFGAAFGRWREKAKSVYEAYNRDLGRLSSQLITDHQRLPGGVTRTTYEDGTAVYVNYSYQTAVVDGLIIAPRSYRVKGGK